MPEVPRPVLRSLGVGGREDKYTPRKQGQSRFLFFVASLPAEALTKVAAKEKGFSIKSGIFIGGEYTHKYREILVFALVFLSGRSSPQ